MSLTSLALYLFSQLISPLPGGHQYTVKEYHNNSGKIKSVKILRNYGSRIECDFLTKDATLIAVDRDGDINPDQIFVIDRQGRVSQYSHPEWGDQKKAFEAAKRFMHDLYRIYFYSKAKTKKNKIPEISPILDGNYQIIVYGDGDIKILRMFDNSAEGWDIKDKSTFVVLDMKRDGKPEYAIKIENGKGVYYTLSKPENFEEKYRSENLMTELYKKDRKARGIE